MPRVSREMGGGWCAGRVCGGPRSPREDGTVIRKAFRMSLNQGHEVEYERRHNPIWPELEEALLEHGVRVYSIYLDPETLDLFGYAEIESEELWQRIART